MKCIILAGGYGTRLWPITRDRAKALLEFDGRPVITHILEKIPAGIDIIVSTNRRFEDDFIRWKAGVARPVGLCIENSLDNSEKLGAIRAVDYVIKSLGITEDLLLIAGDNLFSFRIPDFIRTYEGNHLLIAIHDIKNIERAREFGVVKMWGDTVIEFKEKPLQPDSSLVSTGCYIFPPRLFDYLSEYSAASNDHLGGFVSYLMTRKEEVRGYVFTDAWTDIGTPETYREALAKYG
jgi:glucose-1-phosphate thymidylyltransferase